MGNHISSKATKRKGSKRGPFVPTTAVVRSIPNIPPVQPVVSPPPIPPGTTPTADPVVEQQPAQSQQPQPRRDQPSLLFEIAWEVCWQLGGIYTVLRTKAKAMLDRWGDRYCLIGPYNPATAALEFEEQPTEGFIRQTLDRLREQGITCHYGRWLVQGRPRVILLDYRARYASLDSDKYLLWKDHGIPTVASDGEVNDVVAFGFTVAEFFRELSNVVTDRPILAHFHEWMGGVAVPRIAHLKMPISTVFTTHATLLGRYLASDNPCFYEHLPFLNPDAEAAKYNIYPRHAIEKAAAHASTVFTTVSEVTSVEAQKLLGRIPDAILPNGLNIQRFQALHEFQNLHREYKERIHEFVMGHFFPSYTFDLDNTLYVFTSGRYEYRNKGMDLFIESMWRLNQRLKTLADRPTVIAFIITRAATRHINVDVLQNQMMFEDLKATCRDVESDMGRRLFMAAATGRIPTHQELIPDDSRWSSPTIWRTMPTIRSSNTSGIAACSTAPTTRSRWCFIPNLSPPPARCLIWITIILCVAATWGFSQVIMNHGVIHRWNASRWDCRPSPPTCRALGRMSIGTSPTPPSRVCWCSIAASAPSTKPPTTWPNTSSDSPNSTADPAWSCATRWNALDNNSTGPN
jgi:glycosyltransferase involved in cell wall biosynthesis